MANEKQIDPRRHLKIRISGLEKSEGEKRRMLGCMVPLMTGLWSVVCNLAWCGCLRFLDCNAGIAVVA